MYQDIQNFSQIMDIDIKNQLVIEYELKIHRNPVYKFYINELEISDTKGKLYFSLDDEIIIRTNELSGNGAVEIISLFINGNEILKKYMHKANPPTHWIEKLSHWELKIPKHFYAWYQELTGNGEIF